MCSKGNLGGQGIVETIFFFELTENVNLKLTDYCVTEKLVSGGGYPAAVNLVYNERESSWTRTSGDR